MEKKKETLFGEIFSTVNPYQSTLNYIISSTGEFFRIALRDTYQIRGNFFLEENEDFESMIPKEKPVKFETSIKSKGKRRWARNIEFINPTQF
jgi:hypothetical protein